MSMSQESRVWAAAAAIANARAARKGAPAVSNIMELLHKIEPGLFDEVMEDARVALAAADAGCDV
ncbi:MAG TPA: hypothetical protein VN325_23190 [Steroidobacteraceae bacterium]|nr:hypothetical protein [Steroidobacteraceae bacterium]